MYKYVIIVVQILVSQVAFSQCRLKIFLYDSAYKQPLSLVRIFSSDSAFKYQSIQAENITNEYGYTEISIKENAPSIYAVGHGQVHEIKLPMDACHNTFKFYIPFGRLFNEVIVTGFKNETSNEKTSASIGYINKRLLKNNDQTSLQNAFNSVAGVTMESRGYGGSHRLSIRGSSLRAPFAVRNIKMYADGIPFTSPDGQAPLEMMDAVDISSIEIIKGPAGSVWGSGNGGVVLYKMKKADPLNAVRCGGSFQTGSYDLQRSNIYTEFGWNSGGLRISHTWQDNHGYRDNEANKKNQLTLTATQRINTKHHLLFYGTYYDGSWQLPGGLSMQQVLDNPRQANIYSKNNQVHLSRGRLMGGISHTAQYSSAFSATTSFYSYTTKKLNPYGTSAFNNGYKDEGARGHGGRTDWQYKKSLGRNFNAKFNIGGEIQYEQYDITEHSLLQGLPNVFRYTYRIGYWSTMAFASTDLTWKDRIILNLGSSINHLNQVVKGNAQTFGITDTTASWKSDLLSRIGLNIRLFRELYFFSQYSKGNSNPTVFEMVDYENNNYNLNLYPEHGTNYEAGFKGRFYKAQLRFELAVYQLVLSDAILSYTDNTTAEAERTRFSNSGSAIQRGFEWSVTKTFFKESNAIQIHLQTAGSAYNYRFDDYRRDEVQLSGKSIPGVPLFNTSTSIQIDWKKKLQLDIAHFWFDRTPLNNANSAWSNPYNLVNMKVNYRISIKEKVDLSFFAGINNVLNTSYSSFYGLNDINGRYFNPSTPANYFGGIAVNVN